MNLNNNTDIIILTDTQVFDDRLMIKNESDFFKWLDFQLNEVITENIVAFNININESPFNIEIIGSNTYDPDDEDWACNEDWIPKTRSISVSDNLFGNSWQEIETNIHKLASKYKNSDTGNSFKLKTAKAFAIGFVDGELRLVI